MIDDNKRRKIYDALSNDYDMPSYEQFSQDMADEGKRRKMYDAMAQDYDMPSFEVFTQDVTDTQQQPQQPAQAPTPQANTPHATFAPMQRSWKESAMPEDVRQRFERQEKQQRAAAQPKQQPAQEPAQPQAKQPTQSTGNPYSIATPNTPVYQPSAETEKSIEDERKWRSMLDKTFDASDPNNDVAKNIWKNRNRDQELDIEALAGTTWDAMSDEQRNGIVNSIVESIKRQNPLGPNQRYDEAKIRANAEEIAKNYSTYRAANYMSRIKPSVEEATAATKKQGQDLAQRVKTALDKRGMELDQAAIDNPIFDRPRGGGALVSTFNANTVNGRFADTEWKELYAANNALDHANKLFREAETSKKRGHGNFAATTSRGIANKLGDPRLWDMGISRGAEADALNTALMKADKGDKLTEAEEMLLDAKAIEMAAQMYTESDISGWFTAGEVTAEMLPFMLEMMINPAARVGKSAQSMLTRYALKRFGKQALKKGGEKVWKGRLMRFGGRALGDVAGSVYMGMTTSAPRVGANATERLNGDIMTSTDQEGKTHYAGHKVDEDMTPWKALLEGFGSEAIEDHSEMLGEYFTPMFKVMGKYGSKLAQSNFGKVFRLNKVDDFLTRVGTSDFIKMVDNFLDQTKWDGVLEEYAEEVVGGVENAIIVGDQTLDTDPDTGVFNLKNNLETLRSVGVFGGAVAAVKTLGYRTPKYKARKEVTMADTMAQSRFANGEWQQIRQLINDNMYSDNLPEELAKRMQTMSAAQKRAVIDYYSASFKYNGMLRADEKRKGEGFKSQLEKAYEQSYEQAESPEAKADVATRLNEAQRRLNGLVDQQTLQMLDSEEYGADVYNSLPDNAKAAYNEYRQAQSAMDGVRQRISDDADMMAAEQREEAKKRQYKDGSIHPATLKETDADGNPKEVFVVDGDVTIDDEGNISGGENIVVYDPLEGKNRFLSPSEIAELGEVTTAEQQEQNIEANKQAYIQQQMDAATPEQPVAEQPKGAPQAFEPMMELTIRDDDGNEQQVVVTGGRARFTGKGYEDDPNGKFVELYVAGSEEPRYIREDELKKMVTDYKEAEQPAAEVETPTEEQEEAPVAEQPTEQPTEPADEVEAPTEGVAEQPTVAPEVTIYNNVKGEYPEAYRDKVENTVKIKAKRMDDAKKALDKANADLTATEYGSKEEATAKAKRDKAQQAYDAAEADHEQWKAIKSLKDQEMLAEQEAKDAERKAKAEQRRAETEAARKREQEAYQAELARRKAEKEKKMKARIKIMQEMSEEAAPMEQMAKEWPIENDAEAMEIMNDRSPRTLEEVAAWMISDTKDTENKIDPELVREHTGYGTTDLNKFPFIFKEGGMSPEAFGEKIEQTARENDVVFKDNENGFSALLNVLGEVGGLGDLKNYIKENHRKLAEKVHSDRLREAVARKAEDKSMQQNSGMNDKQQDNYMASMEQAVESGVTMMTDEETEALFSDDAVDPFESKEENQKTNSNDTRTETNDEGGDQRGAEKGGADESEAGQAGVAADDKRGDIQLEGEPQPAEQPAGEVAEEQESDQLEQLATRWRNLFRFNTPNPIEDIDRAIESYHKTIEAINNGETKAGPFEMGPIEQYQANIRELQELKSFVEQYGLPEIKEPVKKTEGADKPLQKLSDVKKFMQSIGYKGSMSNTMTSSSTGKKIVKYYANGVVTPTITLGETTPRDIWRQFHLYGNIMDVEIPADIKADLDKEREEYRKVQDELQASDIERTKKILTEAGIPFTDVIDSERGVRIVFTDRKNDNGNYVDYTDYADAEQVRDSINFIRVKAEKEQPESKTEVKAPNNDEVKGQEATEDTELDALIADYKEKHAASVDSWDDWIKGKSEAYAENSTKEYEARLRIVDALRNVTDEKLSELAKRRDVFELENLIEVEEYKRREAKKIVNDFYSGIAEQGDISKESKPVKTDKILPDFTSRDSQHPVQNCIYYDPDGHAVATDGQVLIASKSQYDPKQKGNMVAAHKVKGAAEKGDVLEGKFPNWKSVIPAESEQKTKINLRKLANFLAGAKDIMKGEKEKESSVIVRMPNGDIVGFDPDNLQKFVQAADAMGVKEVEYGSFDQPLIGRSNDGVVVVMPKLIGTSYDGKKFYYDLAEQPKQQKTGGNATKTSERDRGLLEVVMDKLRKIIGDRLHTTLTEDEKGLINWARAAYHRVFHGSGADFERFDSSHMGEGEGAQSYGYGHYTTEVEGIGRTYAKAMGQYEYQGRKYNDIRDNWKGDDATQRVVLDVLKYLDKDNDTRSVQEAIDFSIKVKELRIARKIGDVEEAKRELDALKNLSVEDFKTSATLYTVEIPDDNGSNYLTWNKTLPKAQRRRIADAVRGLEGEPAESVKYPKYKGGWQQLADMIERNQWAYQEVRDRLVQAFGGRISDEKRLSDLMHSIGFTGIKYPAQFRSGGREDGASNYVIFDDGDLKIIDKIKFFKTPQGEVYGFTVGGNIYVDMDIAKADTPIHEYGHLWVPMVRESDPEMWEDIKRVLTKDKDVKPFMDIVRQRYPELTAEGREDDFMEEVFTHFSGDNGLKMLEEAAREYEEKDGQGFISKAKAIAALNKVKEALDKFWGKVAQLFGIKFRNAREVANKMFKDFMDEVDPTKVRTERIKNEGLKPEEEKTLMGVHNISEEKLRKAMKNGGFANPSMAVIDTKHHMHTDYGDISLIPKSSLIDARTGKNAGTFTADAWTPSYPQTRLRPTSKGTSKFYKDMQAIDNEVGSELGSKLRLYFDSYLDSRDPDAMYWWYLYERGKNPNVATHGNVFGKEITDKVMGVLDNWKKSLDDLSKEEMSQLVDIYHEYKRQKGEEVVPAEERIAIMKQRLANATGDDPEMQRRRERILKNIKEFEKYGEFYSTLDNFVEGVQNTLRRENELDHYSTFLNARKRVEDEGLKNDFNKWLEELNDRYGIESYIFNGYDNYGNQKWVKNTLNNVSRLMKQEGLNGATGVSGIGNWIARVAKKVKTLDQIRAEKKNLKATEEEHDAFRSKWADILYDISRKLDEDDTFVGDNRMSEALDHANPAEYIKQEYGIDLSKKDREAIETFIKEVRETFPTGYFETKFERPVALDEFAVAVVPEETSQDVVDALKNAGLDVRTYDGTPENRQAVTLDAVKGRDDIMFQKTGEPTEPDPFKAPAKEQGEDMVSYAKRVADAYRVYEEKRKAVEDEHRREAAAVKAVADKTAAIRKAMSRQKEFDKDTVKRVSDLAKEMIEGGMLDNMSRYNVVRLMSNITKSVGKEDIGDNLRQVMDIMIDSQLKAAEERLHKLESTRGNKLDSRGVVVQAKLDPAGQQYIQTFKEAKEWDEKSLEEKIGEYENDMTNPNDTIAEEAAWKASALKRALDYVRSITQSKKDESTLKDDRRKLELEIKSEEEKIYDYVSTPMKDAEGNEIMKNDGSGPRMHTTRMLKPQFKENVTEENQRILDETKRSIKQKKEAVAAIDDAIRKVKTDRLEAYNRINAGISGSLIDSMDKAKAFKEANRDRVKSIQHKANSDMEGKELKGQKKDTLADNVSNNPIVRAVLSPLANLDQMLRLFGKKSPDGKGNLWEHFMYGWQEAADGEQVWQERYMDKLNAKVAKIFGKTKLGTDYKYWMLEHYADSKPGMMARYWDGADWREYNLPQSRMMYLYAVDKMPMGKATNRRMGITDEDMEAITKNLDPKLKEFVDWVQEELLPELGAECNEVHRRMFGADMDNIENYFPFVRDKDALKLQQENGQQKQSDKISTVTGAIKKRTASTALWDMPKVNFMDVLTGHIQEMSHWANFAELNRDFSTLLSYNRFKQQVMNMHTVYGAGKKLWKNFEKVSAIATDAYDPKTSDYDKYASQIAKGVTMGKVAARPFTAIKQLLSQPAFWGDANPIYMLEDLATLGLIPGFKRTDGGKGRENAFMWAWRNLPNFRKRIKSRTSGDYYLRDTEYSDETWISKIQDKTKWGMLPNIGVDAWTIALGAHAVYRTNKAKYLRWGMSEKDAEKRAIMDAELCFNKSQQSSEGAFMAPLQIDHTFAGSAAMVFRNSSTSYTREYVASARNLKRLVSGDIKVDDMAKQILRGMGKEEWTDQEFEQAKGFAQRELNTAVVRNVANNVIFGWVLPWAWRLGGLLPLFILGGDDDDKKKRFEDATKQSAFGPVEGLLYGDVQSDLLNKIVGFDDKEWKYIGRSNPMVSDAQNIKDKIGYDPIGAATDAAGILFGMVTGVNPQTVVDWVTAIDDKCSGDRALSREGALLAARLLNCPPSQLKQIYFEELGMNGEEASHYTPQQLIERWAEYKVKNGHMLITTPELMEKEKERSEKYVNEKMNTIGDQQVNEAYETLKGKSSEYGEKLKEFRSTNDYKDGNPQEKAEMLTEFNSQNPQDYAAYTMFDSMDKVLGKISGYYLKANTLKEADMCLKALGAYKSQMVAVMNATSDEQRMQERKKLADIIENFYTEYGNMRPTRTQEEKMMKECYRLMGKIDDAVYDANELLNQ